VDSERPRSSTKYERYAARIEAEGFDLCLDISKLLLAKKRSAARFVPLYSGSSSQGAKHCASVSDDIGLAGFIAPRLSINIARKRRI